MAIYTKIDLSNKSVSGGLGNNLFQIASMIGEAKKNKAGYGIIDTWSYAKYFPNIRRLKGLYTMPIAFIDEKQEQVYQPFDNADNIMYSISGYFQNKEYYDNAKREVQHAFELNTGVESKLKKIKTLKNKKILSIHLRFGDFETKNGYHFMPQVDYYEQALNKVYEKKKSTQFLPFLITNNVAKAKNLLGSLFTKINFYNMAFNQKNKITNSDIEDFDLLTKSDAIITAASTFSFWGAWLSKKKNKVVVCPKRWYGGNAINVLPNLTATSTVPEKWIRV